MVDTKGAGRKTATARGCLRHIIEGLNGPTSTPARALLLAAHTGREREGEMGKTFKIVGSDMSDGYHTFDELYEHRCLLFVRLCALLPATAAWRPDFEGWFCLYLELPSGQISYHVPNKYLPLVEGRVLRRDDYAWDGHTGAQVIERLQKDLP